MENSEKPVEIVRITFGGNSVAGDKGLEVTPMEMDINNGMYWAMEREQMDRAALAML